MSKNKAANLRVDAGGVRDAARKRLPAEPALQAPESLMGGIDSAAIQRAMADPRTLSPRAIPGLQRALGNRHVGSMFGNGLQAKSLSEVPDLVQAQFIEGFEEQVSSSPPPDGSNGTGMVQRAPEGGGGFPLSDGLSANIGRQLDAGGSPLPAGMQANMKRNLGIANPEKIRVHADEGADALSKSLGAKAFTTGNHMFFREGAYSPETAAGQKLLYHEGWHTVQQGGNGVNRVQAQMVVAPAGDKHEQEADQVADQAVARSERGERQAGDEPPPGESKSKSKGKPQDEEDQEEYRETGEELADQAKDASDQGREESTGERPPVAVKQVGDPDEEKSEGDYEQATGDMVEQKATGAEQAGAAVVQTKTVQRKEDEEEEEEEEGASPEEQEKAKEEGQSSASDKTEESRKAGQDSGGESGDKKKKGKEKAAKKKLEIPKKAKPPKPPEPKVDLGKLNALDATTAAEKKFDPEQFEFEEPEETPLLPTWDQLASGTVQMSIEDVEQEYQARQNLVGGGDAGFSEIGESGDVTVEAGEGEASGPSASEMADQALGEGILSGLEEGATSFVADQAVEMATSKIPYADGLISIVQIASDPKAWVQDNVFAVGDSAKAMVEGFAAIGDEDNWAGYIAATLEAFISIVDFINSIVGLINQILTIILFVAKFLMILGNFMISLAPIFVPFFFPFAWTPAAFGWLVSLCSTVISVLDPVNNVVGMIGNVLNSIKFGLQPLAILFRYIDMKVTAEGDPDKLAEKQSKLQNSVSGFVSTATAKAANNLKDSAVDGVQKRVSKRKAKQEIADLQNEAARRPDDPELQGKLAGRKDKFEAEFGESYEAAKARKGWRSAVKLGADVMGIETTTSKEGKLSFGRKVKDEETGKVKTKYVEGGLLGAAKKPGADLLAGMKRVGKIAVSPAVGLYKGGKAIKAAHKTRKEGKGVKATMGKLVPKPIKAAHKARKEGKGVKATLGKLVPKSVKKTYKESQEEISKELSKDTERYKKWAGKGPWKRQGAEVDRPTRWRVGDTLSLGLTTRARGGEAKDVFAPTVGERRRILESTKPKSVREYETKKRAKATERDDAVRGAQQRKRDIDADATRDKQNLDTQATQRKQRVDDDVSQRKRQVDVTAGQRKQDVDTQAGQRKQTVDQEATRDKRKADDEARQKKAQLDLEQDNKRREIDKDRSQREASVDKDALGKKKQLDRDTEQQKRRIDEEAERKKAQARKEAGDKIAAHTYDDDAHRELRRKVREADEEAARKKKRVEDRAERKKKFIDDNAKLDKLGIRLDGIKQKLELRNETRRKKKQADDDATAEKQRVDEQTTQRKRDIDADAGRQKRRIDDQATQDKQGIDDEGTRRKRAVDDNTTLAKQGIDRQTARLQKGADERLVEAWKDKYKVEDWDYKSRRKWYESAANWLTTKDPTGGQRHGPGTLGKQLIKWLLQKYKIGDKEYEQERAKATAGQTHLGNAEYDLAYAEVKSLRASKWTKRADDLAKLTDPGGWRTETINNYRTLATDITAVQAALEGHFFTAGGTNNVRLKLNTILLNLPSGASRADSDTAFVVKVIGNYHPGGTEGKWIKGETPTATGGPGWIEGKTLYTEDVTDFPINAEWSKDYTALDANTNPTRLLVTPHSIEMNMGSGGGVSKYNPRYSKVNKDASSSPIIYDVWIGYEKGNTAPRFTSTAVSSAVKDDTYSYDITTSDPDSGDVRWITAPTKPAWLNLSDNNDGTATLSGTPTAVGDEAVTLQVTDLLGMQDSQSFTLQVRGRPSFTSTAVTGAVKDEPYSYAITTDDPDTGDTRTITASAKPGWLTLTDNGDGTASLSGTPTAVGDESVTLEVTDAGGLTTSQSFTLQTRARPRFVTPSLKAAVKDEQYQETVVAQDADSGDTLAISAVNKPAWMSLVDNGDGTATLSGTPHTLGDETVRLRVEDAGGLTAEKVYAVQVQARPQFLTEPVESALKDELYEYWAEAEDEDDAGNKLTFDIPTAPNWLELEDKKNGRALLSGTPAQAGRSDVELTVTDPTGWARVQPFTIEVDEEPAGGAVVQEQRVVQRSPDPDAGVGLDLERDEEEDWASSEDGAMGEPVAAENEGPAVLGAQQEEEEQEDLQITPEPEEAAAPDLGPGENLTVAQLEEDEEPVVEEEEEGSGIDAGEYKQMINFGYQAKLMEELPEPPENMIGRVQGAAVAYAQVDVEEYDLALQGQQIGGMQQHAAGQAVELQGAQTFAGVTQQGVAAQQADAATQKQAQDDQKQGLAGGQKGAQQTANQGEQGENFFSKIFSKLLEGFGFGSALGAGAGGADAGSANSGAKDTSQTTGATAGATKTGQSKVDKNQAKTLKVQAEARQSQAELEGAQDMLAGKQEENKEGMAGLEEAGAMNEEQLGMVRSEKERLVEEHQSATDEAEGWAVEHRVTRELILMDLEADLAAGPEEREGRLESLNA